MVWVLVGVVVVLLVLAVSVRILKEYERGVAFRLGRLRGPLQPGRLPGRSRTRQADARRPACGDFDHSAAGGDHARQRAGPGQRRRTVPRHRPGSAVMVVENYAVATSQIAQTTLRSRRGPGRPRHPAGPPRRTSTTTCAASIDAQTEPWGVEVASSRSRTSRSPRRCSGRWRARPRRSGNAAPRSSTHAASCRPPRSCGTPRSLSAKARASLQLRYLQTLLELGADQNSTVVFPLPMDIISPVPGRDPPDDAGRPRSQRTPLRHAPPS